MASRAEVRSPDGAAGAPTIESLYELHAPGLQRYCRHLTADEGAADDLAQEVFVRFIGRFPEPPADMNVRAYLNATARNVLWNQLRDAHEVVVSDIETTIGPDDQLERDPERAALLVEQRHLVQRCASLLTGRQRRALTLRDVEGHSYAEIGSELGIGVDAVAQVISRARIRLRSALRRAQIDLDELLPECRAMLGPLSDYVDGRASTSAPALEAHLADCESCRHTLTAYQEAGSRLRGSGPLIPLAGILSRLGEIVRGGGDNPLGIGAAASLATAALAIGGGGMLVAQRLTATHPEHHARSVAAPRQLAHAITARHVIVTAPQLITPKHSGSRQLHRPIKAARPGATDQRSHAASPTRSTGPQPNTPARSTPPAPATPTATPAITPAVTASPVHTPSPVRTSPVSTPTTSLPIVGTTPVSTTHINSLTTPQVTVPTITVPAVTTPAVTVPPVTVPPIATPAITTPIGNIPGLTTPAISTPSVTVPPVATPTISTPAIKIPPITPLKLP